MSDLKAKAGQPVTAEKWNKVIDRLPAVATGPGSGGGIRLLLCRTTELIEAAEINESDTALSVYYSGLVNTHGLINNGDGTFSPGLTANAKLMINAGAEEIPSGTELWAIDTFGGVLVSTVWIC